MWACPLVKPWHFQNSELSVVELEMKTAAPIRERGNSYQNIEILESPIHSYFFLNMASQRGALSRKVERATSEESSFAAILNSQGQFRQLYCR